VHLFFLLFVFLAVQAVLGLFQLGESAYSRLFYVGHVPILGVLRDALACVLQGACSGEV
jgi:hypothetical protein